MKIDDPGKAGELLRLDYDKTLAFIDKADGQLWFIRNWALTANAAIIAVGVSTGSWAVILAALVLVAGFFTLELIVKSFHEDAIRQSFRLEELLVQAARGELDLSDYEFGIGHTIKEPKFSRMFGIVLKPGRWHLSFLHIGLAIVDVLAMVFVAAR
jgi:hypothetical protein